MFRQQRQHVVKKANPCGDGARLRPIKGKFYCNICFLRGALHRTCAYHNDLYTPNLLLQSIFLITISIYV